MQRIKELILKLEGFKYATSLDLNMGYYHIRFSTDASNICTSILPWGKYKYKILTMGVCNSLDIFQGKTNKLFQGFEYIYVYLDDISVLTTRDWTDHLTKLTSVCINFKWTSAEQEVFEVIKQIVAKETLVVYPNFHKRFDIHIDTSDYQLGAVICQERKLIVFYSCKITGLQIRYTAMCKISITGWEILYWSVLLIR